jgi:hypothetical protein
VAAKNADCDLVANRIKPDCSADQRGLSPRLRQQVDHMRSMSWEIWSDRDVPARPITAIEAGGEGSCARANPANRNSAEVVSYYAWPYQIAVRSSCIVSMPPRARRRVAQEN